MTRKPSWLIFFVVWLVTACSTGNPQPEQVAPETPGAIPDKPVQDISEEEQKQVAKTFIEMLIADDNKGALNLFTPTIIRRYPSQLFEGVMKKSREKFGRPVSYVFERGDRADAGVETGKEPASNRFFYTMTFEKEEKLYHIPLSVTFGTGADSGRLVNYKFIVDKVEPMQEKK